jgi:hypothetical protein
MNFGTWNMSSLFWSEPFKTLDRKIGSYRLHLLGVWEDVARESLNNHSFLCTFFMERNWKENHLLGTGLVHQRDKWVEVVSDKMF